MSQLSREAIFVVLSGLTALACDKAATPTAEPLPSAAPAQPGAAAAVLAASAAPAVSATEVPGASGKPEKEKSCAPGGCAPGKCGGNK